MLATLAARRVHVLVARAPGAELLGLRIEAGVRRRGWVPARGPEDADAVVVAGTGDAEWSAAANALWASVAPPHALRRIDAQERIAPALDSIGRVLGDRGLQAAEARSWAAPVAARTAAAEREGALRIARAGPFVAGWPAGLVVDCAAHRGVVVAADARVLGGEPVPDPLDADRDAAAVVVACDRAAAVLRAGAWPAEAGRLERSLDRVLAGEPPAGRRRALRSVLARVRGSAVLRVNLRRRGFDPRAGLLALLADALVRCDGGSAPFPAVDPTAIAPLLLERRIADVGLAVASWAPTRA